MIDMATHIDLLFTAELQFRLASAMRLAVTMGNQPLDLPQEWSHGKHKVSYSEVALRQDQADFAAWSMHRSATFLMAVAMKDAIKAAGSGPKERNEFRCSGGVSNIEIDSKRFRTQPIQSCLVY